MLPKCMECGACCTSFDKKWVEVSEEDAQHIDPELLQHGDIMSYAMKMNVGRCMALSGIVGVQASCLIYDNRPMICQMVQPGSQVCMYSLGLRHIKVSFDKVI